MRKSLKNLKCLYEISIDSYTRYIKKRKVLRIDGRGYYIDGIIWDYVYFDQVGLLGRNKIFYSTLEGAKKELKRRIKNLICTMEETVLDLKTTYDMIEDDDIINLEKHNIVRQ